MEKVAERIVWAVETLAIDQADQVLEIGCGHGAAVDLICQKLAGGKIVAIDRSQKMIEVASRKNQAHIAAGKAEFRAVNLQEADFGAARFNKIFAFNVNVFWVKPAGEFEMVKRLLTSDGAFYLFFQSPDADKTQAIADQMVDMLTSNGFVVKQSLSKALESPPVVCVIAVTA